MFFAGILGQLIFYSQFYKIMKNCSSEGVSLFGFLCGFISTVSWMIYGFLLNNKPLKVSNIIGTIGALLTIISILYYR
jgi:uncharacterized protein with PQ loop repeat